MASIERDSSSGLFHVRFRFGGRAFRRSLKTPTEKLARAAKSHVEETIALLKSGRLALPDQVDPAEFILSGGKVTDRERPRLLTLEELTTAFQQGRIPGVKEANTEETEDLHLRHLNRLLKGRTFIHTLTTGRLQSYVVARLGEKRSGDRDVSVETVRKEIATLRVVWNWARRQGLISTQAVGRQIVVQAKYESPQRLEGA